MDGKHYYRRLWYVVLAMAAILLFGRLGSPLLEPEEARYAEIPRQMLAEGRFVIPVWHGEDYLHKPPLLYWLVMASYQIFGVHDWAARLIPVLASWLVIGIVGWWGRRAAGNGAGLLSALMLTLSLQCPRPVVGNKQFPIEFLEFVANLIQSVKL